MVTKTFALDLVERALWTFVQAFVGTLTAVSAMPIDVTEWKSLAGTALGAGVAAVVSLVKGVAAGVKLGSASTSKAVTAVTVETVGAHAAPDVPPPASLGYPTVSG